MSHTERDQREKQMEAGLKFASEEHGVPLMLSISVGLVSFGVDVYLRS